MGIFRNVQYAIDVALASTVPNVFCLALCSQPPACNLPSGTIVDSAFTVRIQQLMSIRLPRSDFAHASIRTIYELFSELCDMLGSVKIGAAISKSMSGFPVGATVAVAM
jgi:hypothetical protein